MHRPRFDLPLWLCCSGLAVVAFCTPPMIRYAVGRESLPKLIPDFIGSLFAGLVLQLLFSLAGYRLGRRTEQAEDYRDGA